MKVQKFLAASTREALKNVRESLGPDALILSSRQVNGSIEIIATSDIEIGALSPGDALSGTSTAGQAVAVPAWPSRNAASAYAEIAEAEAASEEPMQVAAPTAAQPAGEQVRDRVAEAAAASSATKEEATPDYSVQMASLLREIKHLQGMMAGQLAGLSWGQTELTEPSKAELLRLMLGAGFSPSLSRELARRLPESLAFTQYFEIAKQVLARNLHVANAEDDLVRRGGIYALVGPTGVGKTTTIAKIAARCVLQNGNSSVALLTTDNYRIGAHEQLRIYAKILYVPAYSVKDSDDLQGRLEELADKHLVLIDTAGMSQRDTRLIDQAQILSQVKRRVQRLLLLNATALGPTLEDVVSAYTGDGLDGCVLTKMDESVRPAAVLDVVIRQRLKLHYVTNGQRVPEDLHLADAAQLVEKALETPVAEPFVMRDSEFPLMMAKVSTDFSYAGAAK